MKERTPARPLSEQRPSHLEGAIPNIPNRSNRTRRFRWKKSIYRERNHVERFFNKLKQFRRIATRYDKLGATAFMQLAAIRISLRSIESTAYYPERPLAVLQTGRH
jgi:hypothetical protein